MKKLLLASAVAALSITAAQAAPQVYGKVFLTLDVQDGDNVSTVLGDYNARTQLNSNASRIGFKGSEALTANTDLVYQLEYGVKVDDNSTQFGARDTYLGLANKQYGTLVAGRLTAIDDYVNYANVLAGGVVGGDSVMTAIDGPRANNTFAYFSPEREGLQFMAMYTLDETANSTIVKNDDGTNKLDANGNPVWDHGTDSLGRDAFGVGVKYEPTNAPYKAGATYIQAGDTKATRVSGAYALNPALTVGALYQHTKLADMPKNENSVSVSANYKVAETPWTVYGQADAVKNLGGANDSEAQRIAVGGKYAFNAATTGHVYGAWLQREVENVDADAYGVGAGIEYKF